jgi:uncharacterized protein with PIN domain
MSPEPRFITDRMLGTLTRYLRFMGYNTISANSGFKEGNAKEDTLLLACAEREDRILLTRDAELSRRGKERAVLVRSDDVMEQVQQLVDRGLIVRRLVMDRCSLCNTSLRMATEDEIAGAEYAPRDKTGLSFFWCRQCNRLYWNGSHTKQLLVRIGHEK